MMPMVKTHHKGMIPFKDFPQATHPERLWVLERAPHWSEQVLDLGCGGHKTYPKYMGVDITPGITDFCGSLDELPITSHTVGGVISRHSLEHVLDPIKALQEWHRVLRPEGKVVIVLPDHGVVDTMQDALSAGCHLHAYDRESFRNLIEATNLFTIEEIGTVLEDWSFGAVLRPKA